MELIILGLGGSIGAVLSQLLEFINQWHSATHRPPLRRQRPDFEGNAIRAAELQAVTVGQRMRRSA
jgi:hypothetical protein